MLGKDEEDFQSFETKIGEVVEILKLMNSQDKEEQQQGTLKADKYLGNDKDYQEKISMDDFIVQIKEDRTVINQFTDETSMDGPTMGKMAFMAEMERDANRRAKERRERESVAQNLRQLGNKAFHEKEYEKAVTMYTKALDQIKDSSIFYNNRALTYIRLGLYKRAIIDCDFVIQKLDEKNVRSWLYRANGYFMLGEISDFEKSINEAKKSNPKEIQFIEKVVEQIKNSTNTDAISALSIEN